MRARRKNVLENDVLEKNSSAHSFRMIVRCLKKWMYPKINCDPYSALRKLSSANPKPGENYSAISFPAGNQNVAVPTYRLCRRKHFPFHRSVFKIKHEQHDKNIRRFLLTDGVR